MSKWIATFVACLLSLSFVTVAAAVDYEAKVNCETGEFNSSDPKDPGPANKKHRNYLDNHKWMRWEVTIPKDTTGYFEVEFMKKLDGSNYTKGISPFEDGSPNLIFALESEKEKIKWGRVRSDIVKDAFGYRIICTYTGANGNTYNKIIDPIIEIPRPN